MLYSVAVGVPVNGGDFIGPVFPEDAFSFTSTNINPCVDVTIFEDDIFEGEEEFLVQIEGFRLPEGNVVSFLTGVTVRPNQATVTIEDSNCEFNVEISYSPHKLLRT